MYGAHGGYNVMPIFVEMVVSFLYSLDKVSFFKLALGTAGGQLTSLSYIKIFVSINSTFLSYPPSD